MQTKLLGFGPSLGLHSYCAYIVTSLSIFHVLQFHVTSIVISCLSWDKHISIFWKMESENKIPKFKETLGLENKKP